MRLFFVILRFLPINMASSSNQQPPIRSDLVNAAKQFMMNPRVKQTTLEEQKKFLHGKGLTEDEIEMAIRGIQDQQNVPPIGMRNMNMNVNSSSGTNTGAKVVDFAKTILIIGSTGFMVYQFVRSWLPQWMGMADPAEEKMKNLEEQITRITDSNRAIAESVTQTLSTVTEQNEQISRTLLLIQGQTHHQKGIDQDRLLAELGILKSLLLNQNQFPPIPESALANPKQNGGPSMKIPAWQLNNHAENGVQDEENDDDLDKSTGSEV